MGPLLDEVGALVMHDPEVVNLLNAFFALVFTTETSSQFQTFEPTEKVRRK